MREEGRLKGHSKERGVVEQIGENSQYKNKKQRENSQPEKSIIRQGVGVGEYHMIENDAKIQKQREKF